MSDRTVLVTDYAWPDLAVEQSILGAAGLRLIAGPAAPAASSVIEALAHQHQPVAIMTCWAQVSASAIQACNALRVITRLGVGLDNIALEAATAAGVLVTNVPDYCTDDVSDHAVGMLLALTRGLMRLSSEVRAGRWQPAAARLQRLSALTCGIVGFGRTGRRTAQKLHAFGARVLAYNRSTVAPEAGVEFVGIERLFADSDAVLLHVPLTAETRHLVDARRMSRMRPGALLVNVSRGGLVDSGALLAALEQGQLAGAALDVVEGEPDMPPALRGHPAVLITPHVAFSSASSLQSLRQQASDEIVRVLRGEPALHACNQPRRIATGS